jgi:hypothetical protein
MSAQISLDEARAEITAFAEDYALSRIVIGHDARQLPTDFAAKVGARAVELGSRTFPSASTRRAVTWAALAVAAISFGGSGAFFASSPVLGQVLLVLAVGSIAGWIGTLIYRWNGAKTREPEETARIEHLRNAGVDAGIRRFKSVS